MKGTQREIHKTGQVNKDQVKLIRMWHTAEDMWDTGRQKQEEPETHDSDKMTRTMTTSSEVEETGSSDNQAAARTFNI